jgi:hypothetical protein
MRVLVYCFRNDFTLLRRKPRLRVEAHFGAQARVFSPWMNAGRVPFEAPKERSRVCFGGFRPTKHVEESRALARGAPHNGHSGLDPESSLFKTWIPAGVYPVIVD